MASTYTCWDIINMVGDAVSVGNETAKAPMACNMALGYIWQAFPWRQSLGELPPFYLVPHQQYYGPPAVSVPSDFLGLQRAYHVVRSTSGDPLVRELTCVSDIITDENDEYPKVIGYEGSRRAFKISPKPMSSMGAPWHMIEGEYKRNLTLSVISDDSTTNKVTANNMHDVRLPFDDIYVAVMIEALKWAFWVISSDRRAGGVQMQSGRASQYGQYAAMNLALQGMIDSESRELGPAVAGPKTSLYQSYVAGW
jgi:hypothetical protein